MELILIPLGVLGLVVVVCHWAGQKSRRMIARWASENSLSIDDVRWVLFQRRFSWPGKALVYRVSVSGEPPRVAFLKCGSFFWGLLSNQLEVEWD